MVAYSFKGLFAPKILDESKRQTIRADRRRHARPGEELQLYTGMRTKQCRLVGRAVCTSIRRVVISFGRGCADQVRVDGAPIGSTLDEFARADGFEDWAGLSAFWRVNHPGVDRFEGWLIEWGPLLKAATR